MRVELKNVPFLFESSVSERTGHRILCDTFAGHIAVGREGGGVYELTEGLDEVRVVNQDVSSFWRCVAYYVRYAEALTGDDIADERLAQYTMGKMTREDPLAFASSETFWSIVCAEMVFGFV